MKKSQIAEVALAAVTLNGFSLNDAKKMIEDFSANNNRKPIMTNVWFSKDMIANMVCLLRTEEAIFKNKVGVRIYYGRNSEGKNTVILVSTYDNGIDNQTNKIIHQDYFEHDINSKLFTDAENKYCINGEICTDNSCGAGARLYELPTDYLEDRDCDRNDKHYISKQYATEMVWNFGKTVINTHCEWFNIEMFESFLTDRCNGIRIYFGRRSDLDINYPGLDGFVIVTTEHYIDENNGNEIQRRDYFDCDVHKFFNGQDNGEQCHPNCLGTSL